VAALLFCRVLLCSWQKRAFPLCEKMLLSKRCLRRGEILREAHRVALSLRHREGWRVGARRGRTKRKVDAGSRGRSLRQQGERAPGGPWSLFRVLVLNCVVGGMSSISARDQNGSAGDLFAD
jgi:hypothetical protein